jgi:hypothetical protein
VGFGGFPFDLAFGLWSGDLPGNVTTRKAPRRTGVIAVPSEVVMRVPPAHSYNAGRAGLGWMDECDCARGVQLGCVRGML